MPRRSLSQLSDSLVEQHLRALVARDRHLTAALLAHLAEFDARKLYLPAGYASLWAWCVGELHLSEDAAAKRIHAARAAREFPAILELVADGRLHLSAVSLLAPHLTAQNAGELLAAATHRSKADVQLLLASHAPRPDVPTRVTPLPSPAGRLDLTPAVQHHETTLGPERVDVPRPRRRAGPYPCDAHAFGGTLGSASCSASLHPLALSGPAARVPPASALVGRTALRTCACGARPG